MHALQLTAPREFQLIEQPEPSAPAAGEALVKLEYAGINFIDVYMRSGHYARSQTQSPEPSRRVGPAF